MKKEDITNLINAAIKDNDSGLITAEVLRNVLNVINDYEPAVADELGDGEDAISQKATTEAIRKLSAALSNLEYTYISIATPSTTPVALTEDKKVFYIATEEGYYSNFDLAESISDFSIIYSLNGRWVVESLGIPFMLQNKLNQLNKSVNEAIASLQKQIDTLTGVNTSEAIENLNEIITFFTGINDAETLTGLLAALELSLKNEIAKRLPLDGGTMLGNIDMNGNRIDNIGIEVVNSLPTDNLYEGRMVRFKNKTYTFYNGLWLALSDDLRGHANDTHEENFVYQPTASDLSIKDGFADIKKLKGNTLVWNQLIKNGNFADGFDNWYFDAPQSYTYSVENNVLTIERTLNNWSRLRQKHDVFKNHTYYCSFQFMSNRLGYNNMPLGYCEFLGQYITPATQRELINQWVQLNQIYTASEDIIDKDIITIGGGNDIGHIIKIKDFKIFDLTQMFGAGNEPATVEEFEAMFPKEYYEYNEGELMSFDGKGVKSVGFNQFDKTKVDSESYLLYDTGISSYSKGLKESVSDFIRVIPGTKYYVKNIISIQHRIAWLYDSNKRPLTRIQIPNTDTIDGKYLASRGITIPDNAHYIRFGIYDEYLDSACINLSHSGYRNGDYEPYEDYKISFQDGKTISQLTGKLNGEGESVIIFPDGLRSAGEAFDEIVYDEATGKHKAIKRIGERSYIAGDESQLNTLTDKIYTYYELAEPKVYTLDNPINTSYEAYDFGTEEVLYNDDKEVNIPLKASIEYGFNAVDMIRNNFEEISSLKERVVALEQAILQIQAANTSTETPIEL